MSSSDLLLRASSHHICNGSGTSTIGLRYDPLGRLYEVTGGSNGTEWFLYDGQDLVAEFGPHASIPGQQADDPEVMYVHGVSSGDDPIAEIRDSATYHLIADRIGSIIASVRFNGTVDAINTYDEFGVPGISASDRNTGRFRYTGQIWIPQLGMYHYKARAYSPTLGRFMQTDPIGYGDGMNMYAYVGNNPINAVDPSGMFAIGTFVSGAVAQAAAAVAEQVSGGGGFSRGRIVVTGSASGGFFGGGGGGGGGVIGASFAGLSDENPCVGPCTADVEAVQNEMGETEIVVTDTAPENQGTVSSGGPNGHDYPIERDLRCSADSGFKSLLESGAAPWADPIPDGTDFRSTRILLRQPITQRVDYSGRSVTK